jgi:hypothetical protein
MFVQEVIEMDKRALEVFQNEGHQKAVDMLTAYSVSAGDKLHQLWIDFFAYLFARFRDFIVMEKDEANKECGCKPSMFFSLFFFFFYIVFLVILAIRYLINIMYAIFVAFIFLVYRYCAAPNSLSWD